MTAPDDGQVVQFAAIQPEVLTALEAARFLRLVDEHADETAARRRMNRLVDGGELKPILLGGRRRYLLSELHRFLVARMERHGGAQ